MKKILLLCVLFVLSAFATAKSVQQQPPVTYTCPMHPQIHATQPGNCPLCGMTLVKEKAKAVKKKAAPKPKPAPPKKAVPSPAVAVPTPTVTTPKKDTLTVAKPIAVRPRNAPPRTVRYDLYVRDTLVTFSGKTKRAIAVNGQIPMPTLTFTEGDTAEIYVHNELKESTSLHWHGLFLPNQQDGVPYLTQLPIAPNTTRKYTFPIIQHGTHWYHSHSGLQEQIGMYGSFIMHKRNEDPTFRTGIDELPSIPLILSEWTDMQPKNVHRMLHNASDWFAIQKGTTQSYAEALRAGHFWTKVTNEWKRMNAMDVSDIYYDTFLINGKTNPQLSEYKGGDTVRLRISNGGASSYFWLTYAGGPLTVVASDGNDVTPVVVDRLLIAVAETYDVLVTLPEDGKAYEFLATPEDRTKSVALLLGTGALQSAVRLPKLQYFEGMKMMNGMMTMTGALNAGDMEMTLNKMDMNSVMYPEITGATTTETDTTEEAMEMTDHKHNAMAQSKITTLHYGMLASPTTTSLPAGAPVKELRFELSGNMNRYVWSLDNRVLSETDKILIKKGENVRITLYNGSMMRHPMHLHGHDFRVVNGKGAYAPLKNTLDIMPMETDTIEFHANAEGDWFFHCHILYHMMAGMGRVFAYENQAPNPLLPNPKLAQRKLFAGDRTFHVMAENDFATNGNDGMVMLSNTRWSIGTEWRLGYGSEHGYETETHIGRYLGKMQWWMPFIGFDWRYRSMHGGSETNLFQQSSTKDQRAVFSAGVEYTLPLLVKAQAEVYTDGNVRFQLERMDIPVSQRLRMDVMWNTDTEYMAGLRYIFTRHLSLRTHYDSDMGWGIGAQLQY